MELHLLTEVLLPDGWGHATLNHGFGVGIGVLYDES